MFFEVETFAGGDTEGQADGPVATATFQFPSWITVSPSGVVYVTETFPNGIRKIEDGVVSTLIGRDDGNTDGPLKTASFRGPSGIVSDRAGNLYIADQANHRIRMVSTSGVVTTLAGPSGDLLLRGWVDDLFDQSLFVRPEAIAIDATNANLYIAESARIRRIPLVFQSGVDVKAVRTLAAVGIQGFADGPPTTAQFNSPRGLAVMQTGDLLVADTKNFRIRRVAPSGVVTTVAGDGTAASPTDSSEFLDNRPALQARFERPSGLAVDPSGMVWIADGSHVRMYSPLANTVSTVCSDRRLHQQPIKFDRALGIAVLGGKVFVVDANRIRILTPHED